MVGVKRIHEDYPVIARMLNQQVLPVAVHADALRPPAVARILPVVVAILSVFFIVNGFVIRDGTEKGMVLQFFCQ